MFGSDTGSVYAKLKERPCGLEILFARGCRARAGCRARRPAPPLSGPPSLSSLPPSCVSARVVTLRRVVLRWRRDAVGAEGAAPVLCGCGSCGCGDDGARLW